ncbi:hypothetical protein cyc_01034 [Cyclospora cayetanensis]|uniref:Uncharacterized protein n=1 Tax=Cyclospora cayetanensis TaxID=88456 RepID=A0A1D3DAL0_9EIME|nr:hypothetical protein cyc_01034 [Cyclospora cayetanensis]
MDSELEGSGLWRLKGTNATLSGEEIAESGTNRELRLLFYPELRSYNSCYTGFLEPPAAALMGPLGRTHTNDCCNSRFVSSPHLHSRGCQPVRSRRLIKPSLTSGSYDASTCIVPSQLEREHRGGKNAAPSPGANHRTAPQTPPNCIERRSLTTEALPDAEQELLSALQHDLLKDPGVWVASSLQLREALAAVASLNTKSATHASEGMPVNNADLRGAERGLSEGRQQPSSQLEQLVAAAAGAPLRRVQFLLLDRPFHRPCKVQNSQLQQQPQYPQPKLTARAPPILLPLVVLPDKPGEFTQLDAPEHENAASAEEGKEVFLLLLRHVAAPEGFPRLHLQVRRGPLSQLVSFVTQVLKQREAQSSALHIEEAITWLHTVVAADVALAASVAARSASSVPGLRTPLPDRRLGGGNAAFKLPEIADALLGLLEQAIRSIADRVQQLPPASLLHAVGLAVHLGSPKLQGVLPPHKVQPLLLQLLAAARPLFIAQQRILDARFADAPQCTSAESSGSSAPEESNMDAVDTDARHLRPLKGQDGGEGEGRATSFLPLHDAAFVLGLLGWLVRRGPPSTRAASSEILAAVADCVGERIEALDATEAANLIFAASGPQGCPLAAWQEYLLFMAARHLLRVPMEPLLAARVLCALADVGLEDHTFYATLLDALRPDITKLPPADLGALLRACAKVRARELCFLLPAFAHLESFAASLKPTVAAQALEAAGDLDLKTNAYEGLWRRVCGALHRGQMLHASLLPASLLLLERPQLIQHLLRAWTEALVSRRSTMNKYVTWHIMKKHRFMLAANASGVLGHTGLPLRLCKAMYELEHREGYRVAPSRPESSSFHLEVAAALRDLVFKQEAQAGPFLVDLLLPGQIEHRPSGHAENMTAKSSSNAACGSGAAVIAAEGSINRGFSNAVAGDKEKPSGCESASQPVPKLHTKEHTALQPWDPRRRTEREILFSVE